MSDALASAIPFQRDEEDELRADIALEPEGRAAQVYGDDVLRLLATLDAVRASGPTPVPEQRVDYFATLLQDGSTVTVYPGDVDAAVAAAWAIGLSSFVMSAPPGTEELAARNIEQHERGLHSVYGAWPGCPMCSTLSVEKGEFAL